MTPQTPDSDDAPEYRGQALLRDIAQLPPERRTAMFDWAAGRVDPDYIVCSAEERAFVRDVVLFGLARGLIAWRDESEVS